MGILTDRIRKLENQVRNLQAKVLDLTKQTEGGRIKPESRIPLTNLSQITPIPSSGTGLGKLPSRNAGIIWNDADAKNIPFGQQPPDATKGYNKHFHGRFSGGALDINTLELVEYNLSGYNKDCQAYWKTQPSIELDENGNEKIGSLKDNMVWDVVNKVWRFDAVYKD